MNIYLQLLLLSAIVVFIVDCSGFTDTILHLASKFTARYGLPPVRSLRPFTCSLCMVWWSGIIYALVVGQFNLPVIAFVALLSHLSKTINYFFIFIRESLSMLIGRLIDLCNRN